MEHIAQSCAGERSSEVENAVFHTKSTFDRIAELSNPRRSIRLVEMDWKNYLQVNRWFGSRSVAVRKCKKSFDVTAIELHQGGIEPVTCSKEGKSSRHYTTQAYVS